MRDFNFKYIGQGQNTILDFHFATSHSLVNIKKRKIQYVVPLPGGMSFTTVRTNTESEEEKD